MSDNWKEICAKCKDGDLPLGKEVPFEEWFVSKQEQEVKRWQGNQRNWRRRKEARNEIV